MHAKKWTVQQLLLTAYYKWVSTFISKHDFVPDQTLRSHFTYGSSVHNDFRSVTKLIFFWYIIHAFLFKWTYSPTEFESLAAVQKKFHAGIKLTTKCLLHPWQTKLKTTEEHQYYNTGHGNLYELNFTGINSHCCYVSRAGLGPFDTLSCDKFKRPQKFRSQNIHLLAWLKVALKNKHETDVNESIILALVYKED
jgi:hypothetical protein